MCACVHKPQGVEAEFSVPVSKTVIKLVLVLNVAKYHNRFQQKQLDIKACMAASARLKSLIGATADCVVTTLLPD